MSPIRSRSDPEPCRIGAYDCGQVGKSGCTLQKKVPGNE